MSAVFHLLGRFVHWAFWYCTDFMVSLGNRTHTSYDEANTWVLLLLVPGLLTLLVGVRLAQRAWLRQLRGPGAVAGPPGATAPGE